MKVAVIIVAAGSSTRLKGQVRKPYRLLNDKPMLLHSILTFSKITSVKQLIIAIHPDDKQKISKLLISFIPHLSSCITIVLGGATRSHSVYNALQAVSDDAKIVLIHDAARPFVGAPDINRLIKVVRSKGAAILATPVTDTIKYSKSKTPKIENTLPRAQLWSAQTPQGFRKDIIIKAYQLRRNKLAQFTDDAQVVESAGRPVYIVTGSADNIKITTPVDLK